MPLKICTFFQGIMDLEHGKHGDRAEYYDLLLNYVLLLIWHIIKCACSCRCCSGLRRRVDSQAANNI
jgi:hypothetical protein